MTRIDRPLTAYSCGGSAGIAPASRLRFGAVRDRPKNLDTITIAAHRQRVKLDIKISLYHALGLIGIVGRFRNPQRGFARGYIF